MDKTVNDNPPPLTAEDVALNISVGPPFGVTKQDGVYLVEAYTAQQTAADKARIQELEAKLATIDVREYSRLIGENERLKRERDETNAQVAMLVEKNKELISIGQGVLSSYDSSLLFANKDYAYIEHIKKTLLVAKEDMDTQPTAEQYMADKIEAAVKPWREGVDLLRSALAYYADLKPDGTRRYKESASLPVGELGSIYRDWTGYDPDIADDRWGNKAREALKATEGLLND